jgi:hypothetical protein
MTPEIRQQITQFIRNIITPGGRAFFPSELEQAVRTVAASQAIPIDGKNYPLGEVWQRNSADPLHDKKLEILRSTSKAIFRGYSEGEQVTYESLVSLVYALYYLPRNLHKVQFTLLQLFEQDLLPQAITALDIGTSVGTVPLAVADFYELLHHAHILFDAEYFPAEVDFTCVDASASNLDFFAKIKEQLTISGSHFTANSLPPLLVDAPGEWLRALPAGRRYNLIFISNFLTELTKLSTQERARLIWSVAERLTGDGFLIIIEPADRENSERYHALQYELVHRGLHLFLPCEHINHANGQADCARCWAYRADKLKVPEMMKPLVWAKSQPATDPDSDEVKWCYGIFSRDHRHPDLELTPLEPAIQRPGRGDLSVKVISPPLFDLKGEVVKICGSEAISSLALLRVGPHQALPPVSYGDTLHLKNIKARPLISDRFPMKYELVYDAKAQATTGATTQPDFASRLLINQPETKAQTLAYFLQRLFGFADFRAGQLDVIARTLAGQDTLGIMATSAGKSLCFQFPAMLLPGVAIVVAPLLSLVQDQLYNLRNRFGFDQVERLNSELNKSEREEVLERMTQGYYYYNRILIMLSYKNFQMMRVRWTESDESDNVGPSNVWRDARPTKPAVIRRTGVATVEQFRVNGAPPAQSTRPGREQAPFFGRSPIPNRRQPGLSHHGQSDMSMPAMPVANLVLVQAGLAFGRFETLFDSGPRRCDLGQPFQAHLQGRIGQEVGDVGRVGQGTAGDQPDLLTGQPVPAFDDPLVSPVISAGTFAAFGHSQTLPAPLRPGGHHRYHRDRYRSARRQASLGSGSALLCWPWFVHGWSLPPDRDMRPHPQHIPAARRTNDRPQLRRITIDFIARHPAHRHALCPGVLQHLTGLLGLGLKDHLGRDFGSGPPFGVVTPLFRQVQAPVQQDLPPRSHITQKGAHLTILDLAGGPAILPLNPDRVRPFFEEAGFIHHSNAFFFPEDFDHILLQLIPSLIGLPAALIQQALGRVGDTIPDRLGQLPTVFAFYRGQQAPHILLGLLAWFLAAKNRGKTSLESLEIFRPLVQFCFGHYSSHLDIIIILCPNGLSL